MIGYLLITMLVAGVLGLVLACILVFPRWFVRNARLTPEPEKVRNDPLKSEELRLKAEADRLKAENDVRVTLLQGIGGLAILAGVALTWVQFQATLKATQDQQEMARQQLANAEKQFKETQERNRGELDHNRVQFEATQAKNREDLRLSRQQYEATVSRTREELALSRESQFTERFTRAIDHVGSQQLNIRIGGIYALERLARESRFDRKSIIEVLTAFVRTRTQSNNIDLTEREVMLLKVKIEKGEELTIRDKSWLGAQGIWPVRCDDMFISRPIRSRQFFDFTTRFLVLDIEAPDSDIQAALTVLGRRTPLLGDALDLRSIYVHKGNLKNAQFEKADLRSADLTCTTLEGADLRGARLEGARLEGADLRDANLSDTTGLEFQREHYVKCNVRTQFPSGDWYQKCLDRVIVPQTGSVRGVSPRALPSEFSR